MNWAIIEQVVIMGLLAGVGVLCRKLKLLDDACTKSFQPLCLISQHLWLFWYPIRSRSTPKR